MRTTISLDDDAVEAVKAYGRGQGLSLGQAASELIRRGSRYQIPVRKVDGLPVFDAPAGFPQVTTAQVRRLMDEE
jgi:hypothetical protein